jgi:RimK family alpha-L-glutamate ligase
MPELVMLHYHDVAVPNWRLFEEAAAARGIRLISWRPHLIQIRCRDRESVPYYDGIPTVPAVILHRTVAPFEGIVAPALTLWAARGSRVLNEPAAAYRARDKLATTMRLCRAGVPVVATTGFAQPSESAFAGYGSGPLVVKPAHGLRGRGVKAFGSAAEALSRWTAGSYGRRGIGLREHFVVQPLISGGGRDIRAFVVDGVCLAIVRRQARDGEIRANLALGATAIALPTTQPAARVAQAAVAACGLDYAGVDLIEDEDGDIRVLEVDAWAGFAGITAATGVDIAGAILELARCAPPAAAP